MKKMTFGALALIALAACSKPAPTTENAATALESDLVNRAAALDNEVNADTNAAAANAINGAGAAYNSSDADIVKNGQ